MSLTFLLSPRNESIIYPGPCAAIFLLFFWSAFPLKIRFLLFFCSLSLSFYSCYSPCSFDLISIHSFIHSFNSFLSFIVCAVFYCFFFSISSAHLIPGYTRLSYNNFCPFRGSSVVVGKKVPGNANREIPRDLLEYPRSFSTSLILTPSLPHSLTPSLTLSHILFIHTHHG